MQILANGLFLGAIYALVALGFSISFQITRVFDFSFAATLTVAAYALGLSLTYWTPNFALGVIVACIAAGLLGTLFELIVFRPLRHLGGGPLVLLLASFGLMIVVLNLISAMFGDAPRFPYSQGSVGDVIVLGAKLSLIQLMAIIAMIVVGTLCWLAFQYTRWGRVMRAVANDQTLALCFGVRVNRRIMQAAFIGSMIVGLPASLSSLDTGYTPSIGFQLLLPGVVACVVGGGRSVVGALAAGLAVGIIHEFSGWFISIEWQDSILFGLLVLFLLFQPQRLCGSAASKVTV